MQDLKVMETFEKENNWFLWLEIRSYVLAGERSKDAIFGPQHWLGTVRREVLFVQFWLVSLQECV